MIRYKVVEKEMRGSCVVRWGGKYGKIYSKNKIVKAKIGTLGIFCFKTKKDAINFRNEDREFLIIKVMPKGKGKIPKLISSTFYDFGLSFDSFYKNPKSVLTQKPPKGTICYPAVKVLE